ncbi:hypothetical protein [Bacillus atrophaeus]|uniref:hypothetical protein n=1 Tax=Bacillus atrophaeus TaxID=1452 RepID=UPI0022821D72|nr:hypothetical protein [Bacillus atrophaeus]MCY8466551.1 hypothetical protein [Bacillus atrophaeus]MCY8479011.1 hypothetical protein [Bacillus atrophaeus]
MTIPSPSIEYLQHPPVYVERSVSIGKRLVIIAQSDEGPLYEPILVHSEDMALTFFGNGDLIQCYKDASTYKGGLQAYLMRVEADGYETAFSVLEAFAFDLLFISSIQYGKDKKVINTFLEFCKIKEEKGNLVHGITTLSDKSYDDLSLIFKEIEELTYDNGDDLREDGKYLSIVSDQINAKNAGAVYAGILASVNPEVSPVNKTIPGITLKREYSKEQILKIRSVGLVAFKSTLKKGVTCTSSSCAVSTTGSVHKHISNFRIAQFLINHVSLELQSFIGMPNPAHQALNIEDIIDAICSEHVELNRLKDYAYDIEIDALYGTVRVKIEIVPIFSVHSMITHSHVRIYK